MEGAYEPSVQVKTWEKPQERTRASDFAREGGWDGMVGSFVGRVLGVGCMWFNLYKARGL